MKKCLLFIIIGFTSTIWSQELDIQEFATGFTAPTFYSKCG